MLQVKTKCMSVKTPRTRDLVCAILRTPPTRNTYFPPIYHLFGLSTLRYFPPSFYDAAIDTRMDDIDRCHPRHHRSMYYHPLTTTHESKNDKQNTIPLVSKEMG